MITVPLKVLHKSFEKYPFPNKTSLIYEKEVEVQTIFGPKIRKLKEQIHGTVKRLDCLLLAAQIDIGKGQLFNVILDTGSINLWVAGKGSNDKYHIENHYDSSLSKFSKKTSETFDIKYGTGATKGVYYTDYISFITQSFHDSIFGVASETYFDVDGADGIMGLARSYSKVAYSKIFTMASKGDISSKSFSFKFSSDSEVNMYLGDEHPDFSDESNINNTAQCKLLKGQKSSYEEILWTCKLYQFGLINDNRTNNITAKCEFTFLFDTGSNIMWLPIKTLDSITNQLSQFNCKKVSIDENTYQILCEDENNLPDIFIEVGDHYLILDKDYMFYDYNYEIENKIYKLLNVAFKSTLSIALIGQPFFRLFHTKFDYENKVLKFYNEDSSKIIFSSTKPDEKEPFNYIYLLFAVSVAFSFLVVIFCVLRFFRKICYTNKANKKI